jgi:hypothetical protein
MAQTSMNRLFAHSRSFFICLLGFGVGFGDEGSWFSVPETEVTEKALALPDAQVNVELLLDIDGQGFAVPDRSGESDVTGRLSQSLADKLEIGVVEFAGTPRAITIDQAGQSFVYKAMDPVCHRARRVPQQASDLASTQSLCDHQDGV